MIVGKDGSVVHLQLISGHGKDPSKRRILTLIRRKMRLTQEEAHVGDFISTLAEQFQNFGEFKLVPDSGS
jgi:hypothetical protein